MILPFPGPLAVPSPELTMVVDHDNLIIMGTMKTVSVSDFKATCLALLEEVRQTGRPLLVTKRGVPIAQVTPPPAELAPGAWLGAASDTVREIGDVESPLDEAWEALR
jgi:prevent-host-death family protein